METPAYAGFWNRVAAAIVDGIITAVAGFVILGPVVVFILFSAGGGSVTRTRRRRCSP